MKYLRRWRSRSRAGSSVVERWTKPGGGPSPVGGDRARARRRGRRRPRSRRAAAATPASPSPRSTQSIAPSPCSRIAGAMNEALWPPTQMKTPRQPRLRRLGEVDDLGDVRQVVAREGDRRPAASSRPGEEESRWSSTCRSISRTSCPARRAAAATSSSPSGSSRRKIFVYISGPGWTPRIFMGAARLWLSIRASRRRETMARLIAAIRAGRVKCSASQSASTGAWCCR